LTYELRKESLAGFVGCSRICSCQSTLGPQGSTKIGRHAVKSSIKSTYFHSISTGFHKRFDLFWDKRSRGRTPWPLWRWMKRRAAVEPSIGHLKVEHRLERNRLKGVAGDAINAILSASAMNFQKLLRAFWRIFLLSLMRAWPWIPALQERILLQTQTADA